MLFPSLRLPLPCLLGWFSHGTISRMPSSLQSLFYICHMYIYIYTCSFLQENPLGDALGYLSATFLLILAPCLLRMGWIKNDPYSRLWSQIQKSLSKKKYSFWFSVRGAGAVCALLSASCYQSRWVDCSVCNPVRLFSILILTWPKEPSASSFRQLSASAVPAGHMLSCCLTLDLWKPKKSHSIQDYCKCSMQVAPSLHWCELNFMPCNEIVTLHWHFVSQRLVQLRVESATMLLYNVVLCHWAGHASHA